MIDIHTHILPGVDDGAPEMEVAVAMLAMAAADGITEMIATPHSNMEFRFDPVRCQAELRRVRARCQDTPKLRLGCEVHLTPENLQAALNNPIAFTLNGKDCLLIELPDNVVPHAVDASLRMLMESGFRPIIAHAERNPYIQHHVTYASHLVEMGCYLQVTASSFFGSFGVIANRTADHLMTHRMVHFAASDAHGLEQRRPLLAGAYDHVTRNFGSSTARLLFVDNPAAVIEGAPVAAMRQVRRSWFNGIFRARSEPTKAAEVLKRTQTHPITM